MLFTLLLFFLFSHEHPKHIERPVVSIRLYERISHQKSLANRSTKKHAIDAFNLIDISFFLWFLFFHPQKYHETPRNANRLIFVQTIRVLRATSVWTMATTFHANALKEEADSNATKSHERYVPFDSLCSILSISSGLVSVTCFQLIVNRNGWK